MRNHQNSERGYDFLAHTLKKKIFYRNHYFYSNFKIKGIFGFPWIDTVHFLGQNQNLKN